MFPQRIGCRRAPRAHAAVRIGSCCRAKTANRATASTIELKDNTIVVVLGASGDLAKKKTVGFARARALFALVDS